MLIFWRLVLAHFIADFTLQTNKVASWKRENRWGMAVHVLTHPVVTILCLLPQPGGGVSAAILNMTWIPTPWFGVNGWICVFLLCLFHWLEDEWRVWSIQQTGSPDSTGFFLWDQVVHLTLILAVAPTRADWKTEPPVLVLLCAVLLAHFVSVLVYFLENDLSGSSQVLEKKKYRFMAERFVGAALFLLPGIWFLMAFLWIGWLVFVHYRRPGKMTWVHVAVGNTAVVLLGLIARGLLLS
jgi:hypothetical protein